MILSDRVSSISFLRASCETRYITPFASRVRSRTTEIRMPPGRSYKITAPGAISSRFSTHLEKMTSWPFWKTGIIASPLTLTGYWQSSVFAGPILLVALSIICVGANRQKTISAAIKSAVMTMIILRIFMISS